MQWQSLTMLPQKPFSQTAQLVLCTLRPNILWLRQDQVTSSPSDVTCPLDSSVPTFDHASPRRNHPAVCAVRAIPRKNPVVCMTGKEMQDCKTMQHMQNPDAARLNHSLSDERLEKTRAMTRVTVHPSSMWLSQTVQLILWLVLSRWRRHKVLSVRQVKHPMGSTGMSPSHFTSLFFPAYSLSEKIIQNKTLLLLMYYIYMYIYTHIISSYMECIMYTYIYMCVRYDNL